jgi:hypothetical protein
MDLKSSIREIVNIGRYDELTAVQRLASALGYGQLALACRERDNYSKIEESRLVAGALEHITEAAADNDVPPYAIAGAAAAMAHLDKVYSVADLVNFAVDLLRENVDLSNENERLATGLTRTRRALAEAVASQPATGKPKTAKWFMAPDIAGDPFAPPQSGEWVLSVDHGTQPPVSAAVAAHLVTAEPGPVPVILPELRSIAERDAFDRDEAPPSYDEDTSDPSTPF